MIHFVAVSLNPLTTSQRYRLGTDRAGSTGSNVRECAAEFCEPPCQNNGTCVDPLDNGVFSCSCGPNFFGDLCETNFINPCELVSYAMLYLICGVGFTYKLVNMDYCYPTAITHRGRIA